MEIDADALAVAPLDTATARDPGLSGAKAANLARAAAAGLPVLPGFVIVPAGRAPGLPGGGDALRAAAVYLVIYLYRWEWQRAIVAGVLLLAVEGFLVLVVMLGRLGRIERRLAEADSRVDEIRRRLEHSRDERSANAFRWLGGDPRRDAPDGTGRTFVFVPVLMVTGAALSGLAWVV
ncbi:hypothetical protein [Streptomyces sp. NBC_01198]|uniref:hypothetical protein n=1 Tax=Streptomyces sp. NBC_01198 TaxID=2903769 RepID=UPI002E1175D0|nr:hypothetical protein OG702_02440 [Streptomyces sp. NBC_01198]